MTTNAVSLQFWGFSKKGCYYSWYRQRVSGNSRDVLLVSPPPKALFQNYSQFVIFLFFSSVFHFNIVFCHQPLLRYYYRFVSLVLSLLPLSFLRFCFIPSHQFPAIPFSNPPCFHFRLFRSSILPLCTLLFSGLAFLLSFSCWFLFGLFFLWLLLSPFFITGSCVFCFSSCCFWLCKCGEGCFGFSPRLFFQNHSRFVILSYFSIFHFNIPSFCFMSPIFELTLSFCFSGVLFLAPLHSSFLPTSFLPSPSPIHLAFIFGRFALLFFLSWRFFFFWLGVSFFFFLLVFVWFASDCCCHHFFSLGFFFLVSLSVVFWWTNCGGGWFRFIEVTCAKGVFLRFWWVSSRAVDLRFASGSAASCIFGFWALNKIGNLDESNNGTQIKVRCIARLLTGRGGALN